MTSYKYDWIDDFILNYKCIQFQLPTSNRPFWAQVHQLIMPIEIHSVAHFINFTDEPLITTNLKSKYQSKYLYVISIFSQNFFQILLYSVQKFTIILVLQKLLIFIPAFIIIMLPHRATIEDFSMLTVLGKGAFAKVLLVKHNETQKVYAMKIIPKKNVSAKKQESFITIERNVLVQVNHPFIIKMFYSFQNSKKLFFVLEYCHGGELYRQIAKKHKLPEDHVRFYAAQMVLALEYLHSKNIIYRDLKPENVLIDRKGFLRLTDFGLSDMEQDVITNRGTFQYLPPQVLNKETSGKGVDWWCLGNIIFEMATGLPPFYGNSKAQIADKIRSGQPNYPKSMSQKLKQLIDKLLNKDPYERLGCKGSNDVKFDLWFNKMDWKSLQQKQMQPPYVPFVESDTDTSNFDSEFTECEVNSSHDQRKSMQQQFQHFRDFSYQNKFTVVDLSIKDDSDSDSEIQFQMQMTASEIQKNNT